MSLAETLANRVDDIIEKWPHRDRMYLADQLSRSARSVVANLSEGYARIHEKELIQFVGIARGSLEETLSWIRAARSRGLISRLDSSNLSDLYIRLSRAIANFAVRRSS